MITKEDATIFDIHGQSLAFKKLRLKELCDEEYEIQCDTSGDSSQFIKMAIHVLQCQIEELEKTKKNVVQK